MMRLPVTADRPIKNLNPTPDSGILYYSMDSVATTMPMPASWSKVNNQAAAAANEVHQSYDEHDESSLIAASRAGNCAAFAVLYRRLRDRIYALCWRMCAGDRGLAEDLTQEAFVQAWRKLDSFRGDAAFSTWLHRLAVNVVLGDKRRQARRLQTVSDADQISEVTRGSDDWEGGDQDLERAIARLPERARTVLVLNAIEGYSHAEISEATGMAEGSSKAQLHRARQLLKQWLEE